MSSDHQSMHEEFLDTYDRSEEFLDAFFHKYTQFLIPKTVEDPTEWRSAASMLTILGAEYGIQGNANKALELLDKALTVVERGCDRLGSRVTQEETYTNAVWFKAMVYENSADFPLAIRLFVFCSTHGPEELRLKCERSIDLCRWKLRNRTAIRFLVAGIFLLTIGSTIRLMFTEFNSFLKNSMILTGVIGVVVFLLLYRKKFRGRPLNSGRSIFYPSGDRPVV